MARKKIRVKRRATSVTRHRATRAVPGGVVRPGPNATPAHMAAYDAARPERDASLDYADERIALENANEAKVEAKKAGEDTGAEVRCRMLKAAVLRGLESPQSAEKETMLERALVELEQETEEGQARREAEYVERLAELEAELVESLRELDERFLERRRERLSKQT